MLSGFHHVLSVRSHLEAGGAEQGILRQRLEHLRPGDRGGEPARPRPRERRRHLRHEGDEAGEFCFRYTIIHLHLLSFIQIALVLAGPSSTIAIALAYAH